MRFGLALVLAGSAALPSSAGAQAGEEATTAEPSAEEPAPSTEPAPEEPALQLKLDDAGIQVIESPPPIVDGYPRRIQIIDEPMEVEEMELRVRRAGIGLGVSAVVFVAGVVMGAVAASNWTLSPTDPNWIEPALGTSAGLIAAGGLAMIATSALLGVRKRKLRRLKPPPDEEPPTEARP